MQTIRTEQATLIDIPVRDRNTKRLKVPPFAGVDVDTYLFRWPDAARQVWKRPRLLPVSEWAGKYRVSDDVSPRPGPWNNDYARFLCGPMDVFSLPFIRKIVVVAPQQTGKTEIIMNCLASVIDQAPGPALVVFDQQDRAKLMCTTRVKNMIDLAPRLARYKTGKADDFSNYHIQLRHMRIPFAWATSVSQLSNVTIEYLFLDEVEKYEATFKTEAGPVAQAEKRTRQYKDTSKTVLSSSPGLKTGEITVAYNRAQVRAEFVVVCPDCQQPHVMTFTGPNGSGVIWPKEERNPEIIEAKKLARYICPECGCADGWDDYKRDLAVHRGYWREKETRIEIVAYCKSYRPRSVGFQYSALLSSRVSLSETAARFVLAKEELKRGNLDAYKDWLNGYMGEAWEEDHSPRAPMEILVLRDERPAGMLPPVEQIAALVATVDTQDDGHPFEIRAWGYGSDLESWQIRAGMVENLAALDKVLWIPYYDARGNQMVVQLTGIDSQGHLTREVYEWCVDNRGRALPIKGHQSMREPYKLTKLEVYPGTTEKIRGGLQLLNIHTNYYKNALNNKLKVAPADPGAWHMNAECTEAWAREMTVEYVNEKNIWVCPKHAPNHAWDVSGYSFCLADLLGVRYMEPEQHIEESEPEQDYRQFTRQRPRMW